MVTNFLLLIFVALLIVALPAFYEGHIDATTAMLLGFGAIFVTWFLVRLRSTGK